MGMPPFCAIAALAGRMNFSAFCWISVRLFTAISSCPVPCLTHEKKEKRANTGTASASPCLFQQYTPNTCSSCLEQRPVDIANTSRYQSRSSSWGPALGSEQKNGSPNAPAPLLLCTAVQTSSCSILVPITWQYPGCTIGHAPTACVSHKNRGSLLNDTKSEPRVNQYYTMDLVVCQVPCHPWTGCTDRAERPARKIQIM